MHPHKGFLFALLACSAAPAAAARPASVEEVAVRLDLDVVSRSFRGEETLTVRAPAGGADAVALDTTGLSVGGLRPGAGGTWRLGFELRAGATAQVRLGFSGGADAGLQFGPEGAFSRGDDEGGGRWFPRPAGRARLRVSASAPPGWTVVTNGSDPADSRPLPLALAALYAGPYVRVAIASAPVAVDAWVPAPRAAAARAAFASAPGMLARFAAAFGAPYPWARLSLTTVARPRDDGFENAGAPRFDDAALDSDMSELTAHELVHQWLGAWVSPASPSDAWLFEAFATWYAAPDAVSLDEKARALFRQEARAPRALRGAALDPQSYGRGAWFLQSLRSRAGAKAFDAAVRRFVREHGGRAAAADDFRAALETESGLSFAAEFAEVPDRAAHARVRLTLEWDAGESSVTVSCAQVPAADGGPAFSPRVPLVSDDGTRRAIDCGPERTEVSWTAAARPRWVAVDPEQTLLLETERGWPQDMVLAELAAAPAPVSRARAADELAEEPSAASAAALRACASGDPVPSVAAACARALERRFPRRERP